MSKIIQKIRDLQGNKGWKSTGGQTDVDARLSILSGVVPPELLGAGGLPGGSLFSGIAHETQQLNQMKNLLNSGTHDEIYMQFASKKGGEAIKTPIPFNGKIYYPDEKGVVRIANKEPLSLQMKVRKFQEDRTDALMDMIILGGDDAAAYIFGFTKAEWMNKVGKGKGGNLGMSAEMVRLDGSMKHIETLVDGSQMQSQCLSKLRFVCKKHLANVNLENFSSLEEDMSNMKSGKNVIDGDAPAPVQQALNANAQQHQQQQQAAGDNDAAGDNR